MSIEIAQWIVLLAALYVGVGLLVAPLMIFLGAHRLDAAAKGSTRGFRFIVLPGAILLWPVLLKRLIARRGHPPEESGAHRRAHAASNENDS